MASSSTLSLSPSNQTLIYNTPKKPLLNLNLDPISMNPSYTSLKDVLPFSGAAHQNVSIRNRLVKQAAWAYLQPMSTSPSGPAGPHLFRRLHNRFSSSTRHNNNPLTFLYHHILPSLTRTLRRILHAIPCFLCAIQQY
ncbi:hypothetical protein VNO78_21104 [Psophocarpus tetragonolobus]|uniref:Uncharacterized protein n=1 Tax=Psophocarpus tetragonolobus TaxID=3891 RepID=A0AAN9SCN1_PSOTE